MKEEMGAEEPMTGLALICKMRRIVCHLLAACLTSSQDHSHRKWRNSPGYSRYLGKITQLHTGLVQLLDLAFLFVFVSEFVSLICLGENK